MTEKEFEQWWDYHCFDAHPSAGDWFAKKEADGYNVDGIKEVWFGVLRPVILDDAIAASKGIASGLNEEIERYDIDKTPRIIRRIAFGIKERRESSGPEKTHRPRSRSNYDPMMAHVFKGMASRRKEGVSQQEINQWAMETLASQAMPDDPRNAYKCLTCSDTGWVLVWHPLTHRNAVAGYLEELRDRPTCTLACRCDRGVRHQENHNRLHPGKDISFDREKHIHTTGVSDVKAIEELKVWAQQVIDARHENEEASLL